MTKLPIPALQPRDAGEVQVIPSSAGISDRRFIAQLDHLRNIKEFLFQEKFKFKESDVNRIDLEGLNNLFFDPSGRVAEIAEWRLLDSKLSILSFYLGDDLKRKMRVSELHIFFKTIPLIYLIVSILSVLSITLAVAYLKDPYPQVYFPCLIVSQICWAASQGGLGACAFLGISVIARTPGGVSATDALDLTNAISLRTRIILGTLFGFLFGLPFSQASLNGLYHFLTVENTPASELLPIFVPFIVGYSHSLVMAILAKFIAGVRTVFGLPEKHK